MRAKISDDEIYERKKKLEGDRLYEAAFKKLLEGQRLENSEAQGTVRSDMKAVPTASGLVSIDHNRPDYAELSDAFDKAISLAEQTRPNEITGDQHASIVSGLRAARELWNSFELTRLQIEVGLIMALEKAQEQLRLTFESARGTLFVEAIKAFFP